MHLSRKSSSRKIVKKNLNSLCIAKIAIWLTPTVGIYTVYNRKRFFQAGNRIFNNPQYLHCNHCVGELSDSLREFRLYLGFHFCRDILLCNKLKLNCEVITLWDTHTRAHARTHTFSLSHMTLISITGLATWHLQRLNRCYSCWELLNSVWYDSRYWSNNIRRINTCDDLWCARSMPSI